MLDKELLDWKQKDEKKSNETIVIEKKTVVKISKVWVQSENNEK